MEIPQFELPTTLLGWIGLAIGSVVLGMIAYRAWNQNKDGADDRLINILKGTVDELEKKVNKQTVDIEELTKKVQEQYTTIDTLTKVLQGRDEATLKFQKEVIEAVRQGNDTNKIVRQTNESLNRLENLLSQHLKAVEKLNVEGGAK